jgi:hypothetical protein
MTQPLRWVWLPSAAVVGYGIAAGLAPVVALGIGLAASLSLSGSI